MWLNQLFSQLIALNMLFNYIAIIMVVWFYTWLKIKLLEFNFKLAISSICRPLYVCMFDYLYPCFFFQLFKRYKPIIISILLLKFMTSITRNLWFSVSKKNWNWCELHNFSINHWDVIASKQWVIIDSEQSRAPRVKIYSQIISALDII